MEGTKLKKTFGPFCVLGILIAVVLLFTAQSKKYDLSPPGKGWKQMTDKGIYKTYSREGQNKEVKQVVLVGILDYTPEQIFNVCTNYKDFAQYLPNIDFAHVIHVERPNPHERISYVFYFFKAPLVSPRYYTLKYDDYLDVVLDGKPGCYKNTWHLVLNGMYHETPESPGIMKLLNNNKTSVQLKSNEGFWQFDPLDGGKKTKMTFCLSMDPGGNIPHWISNKLELMTLPQWWDAIHKRLKNPTYHK